MNEDKMHVLYSVNKPPVQWLYKIEEKPVLCTNAYKILNLQYPAMTQLQLLNRSTCLFFIPPRVSSLQIRNSLCNLKRSNFKQGARQRIQNNIFPGKLYMDPMFNLIRNGDKNVTRAKGKTYWSWLYSTEGIIFIIILLERGENIFTSNVSSL